MRSTARQQRDAQPLSDQLKPLRLQVTASDNATALNDPRDNVLPFPELLAADDIVVPADTPSAAPHVPDALQLRSNQAHWLEFERAIDGGDFAAAKTVIEYLDKYPQLQAQLCGLYVKACITIKREQILYAQTKDAAVKRVVDAEVTRQNRSILQWIARGFNALRFAPNAAAIGLGGIVVLALNWLK